MFFKCLNNLSKFVSIKEPVFKKPFPFYWENLFKHM